MWGNKVKLSHSPFQENPDTSNVDDDVFVFHRMIRQRPPPPTFSSFTIYALDMGLRFITSVWLKKVFCSRQVGVETRSITLYCTILPLGYINLCDHITSELYIFNWFIYSVKEKPVNLLFIACVNIYTFFNMQLYIHV